jgi:hypothetical protein
MSSTTWFLLIMEVDNVDGDIITLQLSRFVNLKCWLVYCSRTVIRSIRLYPSRTGVLSCIFWGSEAVN